MDTSKMTPEETIRWLQLQEVLNRIDLDKVIPAEVPATPREKLIRDLETQSAKAAITKIKKHGKRRKMHWKMKKRKQRERMRPYMAERYKKVLLPQRRRFVEDRNWYGYYVMEWKKRATRFELTEEQWNEKVGPRIPEDRVPSVFRIDTSKPVSLANIVVRDSESRTVFYDGTDEQLRELGVGVD